MTHQRRPSLQRAGANVIPDFSIAILGIDFIKTKKSAIHHFLPDKYYAQQNVCYLYLLLSTLLIYCLVTQIESFLKRKHMGNKKDLFRSNPHS